MTGRSDRERVTGAAGWAGLAGWTALSVVAAGIGGIGSRHAADFYYVMERPAWAPPASAFGPVWTLLYAMMAVAAWLVWREGGFARTWKALALYLVQISLNAGWSWLFFAWREGEWAMAEIVLLGLVVAGTTFAFWRIRPLAALLMLPYLAWVAFAAALNWSLLHHNPILI